jgi:hypothetical protein
MKASLWTCPRCGAKLAKRNVYHACGQYSIEKFLAGKGPQARALFNRFVRLVRRCGPFEFAPAKTRVAFMVRIRFAWVSRISERGMTAVVELPRRLNSPRIGRIEHPTTSVYVHYFRVTSLEELDDEVLAWLKESYRAGK